MNRLIIDRFEGEFAICEDKNGEFIRVLLTELPGGVKEGDFLVDKGNGYITDDESKEDAKKRIEDKLNSLFCD